MLEHVPHIVDLFPVLSEITETDWGQEGIDLVELQPNLVIEEGQFLEYAVMVLDGSIRMYKISSSGREITMYRIYGGECCPLMTTSILGESQYEASACIEKPTMVLAIPVRIFRDWTDEYKGFRQFIFKMIAKRFVLMSNLLDSINFKSIRGRLAEYLLQAIPIEQNAINATHDLLANEIGSAREVVSRTLKMLEKEKIIEQTRGKISIVDRSALEQYLEL
ncbi:Crp/Fnr family transcriptional regulator [Paenibacillus albus]|uniref:Crp/Fnr family transcriptional regulator n=1 Tax=Paenibacillus albus TaxID=2495582 RepID=A0A3S9ADN1_9BACL|nr:Crp/Fnr family transcriptional regulator [Paenibacillus albus]